MPLEELIAENLDALFPGMEILDHAFFRVTRDADFTVSDEADDLLQAVEDELRARRFGEVVRVEVSSGMSEPMREQITRALEVEPEDVFEVPGLLDLNDLWDIVKVPGFPELRDPPWTRGHASRGCSPTRTSSPTCSARCASATSCSTTPTTRSRARSSASSSRR